MRFSPTTPGLLACRFSWSAVHELASAVRALARGGSQPALATWRREVGTAPGQVHLAVLSALFHPARYNPDFLLPPPLSAGEDIRVGLARVATAPPAQVRAELAVAVRDPVTLGLPDDPNAARDALVRLLTSAWEALVAPWWPRVRAGLEADIAYRRQVLADQGLGAALAGLHPKVQRDGCAVVVDSGAPVTVEVGPAGVVFVPSVFESEYVGVSTVDGAPALIAYGARGAATVWETGPSVPDALAALVGRTRSALLVALDEPATTSGLAARCGVPLSSASDHLAVLRDAGLVSATRIGRSVLHRRTPLGTTLCAKR